MMISKARPRGAIGRSASFLMLCLFLAAGCNSDLVEYSYPESRGGKRDAAVYSNEKEEPGIFGGPAGFTLFGGDEKTKPGAGGGPGISVNSYLWRASLDTISFMPLTSADPFGGVIITDWYAPPETPTERFKMNIYILGRQLRADGVRVSVFRQSEKVGGGWTDMKVTTSTNTNLENQILTRARQLRVATASN